MSSPRLSILILSAIAVLPYNYNAQAQDVKYRAGVINVTEVQAQPDGSARHFIEVRQQLEGSNPTVLFLSGVKAISVTDDAIPAEGDKVLDLTGEVYSNKMFTAVGSSSKGSLTPSTVQDQSLGCRLAYFGVQDRIDSLENISLSNADFNLRTDFNIVDNSNRASVCASGTCQVHNQIFPAPNYTGPLYFEGAVDKVVFIDLKPHIKDASGSVTCKLVTDKGQHGIVNTGLAVNPPGLEVSTDCVIKWLANGTQIGEKYAFRTVITSSYKDPSCGNAYTQLDLMLQAGCSQGDLSCMQCGPLDFAKIFSDTEEAFKIMMEAWSLSLKSQGTLTKKLEKTTGKVYSQDRKRILRTTKKLKAKSTEGADLFSNARANHPASTVHCLRPSKIFCQSQDISAMIAKINQILRETEKGSKQSLRAIKKLEKVAFQSKIIKTLKSKTGPYKKKIKLTLLSARASVATLPQVINSCN